MTSSLLTVAALAVLSLSPFTASAHNHDGKCKAEVESICPNMKKGEGLLKCIKENKDKFSAECQERGKAKKDHFQATFEACEEDIKRLCKDIKRGGGRVVQCLKANSEKLSPACQEGFK